MKTVLSKGYDVLLCTQDVDEFCFQADACATYRRGRRAPKSLKNVASGDLGLETEDEKSAAEADYEGKRGPVRRHAGRRSAAR